MSRALIGSLWLSVVIGCSFPYDLSPPCPKPGRAPRLASVEPPPVPLPGVPHVDASGRRLREIPLAGASRLPRPPSGF